MKLHLPLFLRSALLVACAALATHPAGALTYPTHSSSSSSPICTWGSKSLWRDAGSTTLKDEDGKKYTFDNILVTPTYWTGFFVTSGCQTTQNDSGTWKHTVTYSTGITAYAVDGGGADLTYTCSSFDADGNLTSGGVWIFAEEEMMEDGCPITLSHYKDIVISDSRQQYIIKKASELVENDDGTYSVRYQSQVVDYSDSSPTKEFSGDGIDTAVNAVGFNLLMTDTDSFTYQRGYTASHGAFVYGGCDVAFRDVVDVSFIGNQAKYGGVISGNDWSFTIENAKNVTFSGNVATESGAIGYAPQTSVWSGEKQGGFQMWNVDNALFADNQSAMFRNVSCRFDGVKQLTFSGNDRLFIGYNAGFNVSFTNNGHILFSGNNAGESIINSASTSGAGGLFQFTWDTGAAFNLLFQNNESIVVEKSKGDSFIKSDTNSSIKFIENGEIVFRNNHEMTGPLLQYSSQTVYFQDNDSILFEGNTSTSGRGISKASLDVSDSRALNTSSFQVLGNTFSGNTGVAICGTISLTNLHTYAFDNNEVDTLVFSCVAGETALNQTRHVHFDNNTIKASELDYGVFSSSLTMQEGEELSIKGNKVELTQAVIGTNVYGSDVWGAAAFNGFMGDWNVADVDSVIVESNSVAAECGANFDLLNQNEVSISGAESVAFLNNVHGVVSGNAVGAALWGETSILSSESVTISGNIALSLAGRSYGGALSSTYYQYGDGFIRLQGNGDVIISDNVAAGTEFAGGGALYANEVSGISVSAIHIVDNARVLITGNMAKADTIGTEFTIDSSITNNASMSGAYGGAILSWEGDVLISGNGYVESRGNYVTDGSTYQLSGLVIANRGDLNICTPDGGKTVFFDPIHVVQDVNIGSESEGGGNNGEVIFSGKYAQQDLQAIKTAGEAGCVTEAELNASLTHVIDGRVRLYSGSLIVEDGACLKLTNGSILMPTDSPQTTKLIIRDGARVEQCGGYGALTPYGFIGENAQLILDGGTLDMLQQGEEYAYGSQLCIAVGARMEVKSPSVLKTSTFSVTENGILALQVSSANERQNGVAVLTFESKAYGALSPAAFFVGTVDGKNADEPGILEISVSGSLTPGEYTLLSVRGTQSIRWSNDWRTGANVMGMGEDDVLQWCSNDYSGYDLIWTLAENIAASRRDATTLTWIPGSGVWKDGMGAEPALWSGRVDDLNFYSGDTVVFDAAAEVELSGRVSPASVLVSNREGTVELSGSGQITDVDSVSARTTLIKTGAGVLRVENANAYTGGTTLQAGTLELGDARALGLGDVTLEGGTLNMGKEMVANAVRVDGTVQILEASAYAGELSMTGGSLSGDAINLAQKAILVDGEVANELTGQGVVLVVGTDDDTVTLTGANSYSGGTVLESGSLELGHVTALGSGDITLMGGALNMGGHALTNDLTVEGHVILGHAAAYAGKLAMDGGSLSGEALQLSRDAELREGRVSVPLTGTAGVVKTGAGTATLAGANTYTGLTAVQQGTLVLEGSVAGDITVASKATLAAESPLVLKNQTLSLAKNATVTGDVSASSQSVLAVEGSAKITGTLTLDGAVLRMAGAGLNLGTLVTSENSTLVSVDNLANYKKGSYKLVTYKKSRLLSDLQLDNVVAYGERSPWTLTTSKTAVTLVVDYSNPTLTWTGQTGSWSVGNADSLWSTKVPNKAFHNGDNVVFGMPAEVEITTQVAPSGITVQGKGEVHFHGEGAVTGITGLVMKSSGTLTIETANSYTGGTTISKGTVVVGHESALGTGSVTLKGGTLDMGGFNIANELSVGANSTLSGADTYTGTLTVNKGTLTLLSDVAGDIELAKSTTLARKESSKDKTFSTLSLAEGASLALGSGAKVKGSLELTSGQTLSTAGKNSISETLTLGGGTVIFGKSGLSVKDIAITSETDVEVSDMLLYKKGSHKLISYSAKDATPDVDKLQLDSTQIIDSRMEGSWLSLGKKAIMLNITESCAKLSWKSDEAGTWSVKSGSEWTAAKSVTDTHFYQGDHVTLSKGALTLEGELAPGSITVNVGAKDSVTLSGDGSLVGGTSLIMKGKGALTLNTANSYTGGTTISSGSVALGHAEALGSGAVELKGGSLDLNEEALGNDLIVSKNATLLGAQNYTGTLTHNGGTLKGDSINLAEDAIIKAGTIMNTLVGEGGLIKTGKGSATLAGENSYTGLTDVQGGNLILKNNHSGSIRLGDKTKLTLSNSSKTLSLGSGQRLSLGSGASVSGSVSMGSNSWLSTSSKSSISGTLTLGGGTLCFDQLGLKVGKLSITGNTTLDVSGLTFEKAGSYQLISYKGAATATDYLELLGAEDSDYTYTLQSGKNTLTLIVSEAAEGIALLSEDEPLESQNDAAAAKPQPAARATAFATDGTHARRLAMGALLSSNQRSVYEALCAVADSGSANQALANISQAAAASNDLSQLRTLLESVSGAQYATAMSSQIEGNLAHLRLLGSRAGSGQQLQGGDGRLAAYMGATSSNTHIGADASGYGYDRNEWGGQVGAEYRTACGGTLGLAVSESLARINPSTGKRAEETRTSFDLYGLKTIGSWNFRTMAGVGIHRHEYQPRDIAGLVASNAGKTHLDGYSLNFVEDISYTVRLSDEITLQPFAAVESSFNHISSFREAGYGTASLSGASQQAWATDITLGLRYNQQFHLVSDAPQAVFSAHVGSTASIGDTADTLRLHFAGAPGYGFEQRSAKRDRWAMSVGTSVNVPVSGKTSIYASVDALLRGDSSSVDAQAGVQIAF